MFVKVCGDFELKEKFNKKGEKLKMNLSTHYYSMMSGLMASLGSFFGKMITFSGNAMVNDCFMFYLVVFVVLLCVSETFFFFSFTFVAWLCSNEIS